MTKEGPMKLDFTPEEIAQVMAEMKAKFTADDLYDYIENTEEGIPADVVMAEIDEIIRKKWGITFQPEQG
jgi:hypothetical protein